MNRRITRAAAPGDDPKRSSAIRWSGGAGAAANTDAELREAAAPGLNWARHSAACVNQKSLRFGTQSRSIAHKIAGRAGNSATQTQTSAIQKRLALFTWNLCVCCRKLDVLLDASGDTSLEPQPGRSRGIPHCALSHRSERIQTRPPDGHINFGAVFLPFVLPQFELD